MGSSFISFAIWYATFYLTFYFLYAQNDNRFVRLFYWNPLFVKLRFWDSTEVFLSGKSFMVFVYRRTHKNNTLQIPNVLSFARSIINCNSASVSMMCAIVVGQMVKRRKGLILNVSSCSAVLPTPLMCLYSGAKVRKSKKVSITFGSLQALCVSLSFHRLSCTNSAKIWPSSMHPLVLKSNAFCRPLLPRRWVDLGTRLFRFPALGTLLATKWTHGA